ncbi:MAG: hypothetical protein ACOCUI_00365 [bacterium]
MEIIEKVKRVARDDNGIEYEIYDASTNGISFNKIIEENVQGEIIQDDNKNFKFKIKE